MTNGKSQVSSEHQESHPSESEPILDGQRKIHLAREGLYSFLARSFKYEVDNEFLTIVAAVQPVIEDLASAQHGAELKKASELLATISSKAASLEGPERKKLLGDLAIEYSSLFINPDRQSERERVFPWESAYFSNPPRMFGEQYHQVVEAYRMVDFKKPKEYTEPEDHIALELEFMAHLCRLTTASIDKEKADFALGYVKLQKEFLADHLLRWIGKFSEKVMKNSQKRETDFYYALAMMLETFITMDDQTLDQSAAELKEIAGKPETSDDLKQPEHQANN